MKPKAIFGNLKIMSKQQQINQLVKTDSNLSQLHELTIVRKLKDWHHLERRQQQRAINECMMKIALMYGQKHYDRGAVIYTLNDRALQHSPYAKFTDMLRGLTVVCKQGNVGLGIVTTYWQYNVRQ